MMTQLLEYSGSTREIWWLSHLNIVAELGEYGGSATVLHAEHLTTKRLMTLRLTIFLRLGWIRSGQVSSGQVWSG